MSDTSQSLSVTPAAIAGVGEGHARWRWRRLDLGRARRGQQARHLLFRRRSRQRMRDVVHGRRGPGLLKASGHGALVLVLHGKSTNHRFLGITLQRLPAGAHVVWLDQVLPMYRKDMFSQEALIMPERIMLVVLFGHSVIISEIRG